MKREQIDRNKQMKINIIVYLVKLRITRNVHIA